MMISLKLNLYFLKESLHCYNNERVDSIEAACAVLKRFAYPCSFIDIIQMFDRLGPQLSIICNQMTNLIYEIGTIY